MKGSVWAEKLVKKFLAEGKKLVSIEFWKNVLFLYFEKISPHASLKDCPYKRFSRVRFIKWKGNESAINKTFNFTNWESERRAKIQNAEEIERKSKAPLIPKYENKKIEELELNNR